MHRNKFYILGKANNDVTRVRNARSAYGAPTRVHNFISLFSGAMGLDLGLEMSGLAPCGCLEWDKWACGTIRKNRPNLPLIEDDIQKWNGKRLMERFGLSQEISVIVGGPPCPSFSTAGRRQSFNDPRGEVMFDFLRIVKELRPAFFVMENVRGILSASIKHRPLALRTRGGLALAPEEEAGSVLRLLHREFKDMGYVVSAELVNAANYGTPQLRERVVFLGSRDGFQVTMPTGDYGPGTGPFLHRWKTLRDALKGLRASKPEYQSYSENRLKYLRLLTEGQNWRALPPRIQKEAMGGAYESSGGKVGFYRRLSFDKPCPTVPTSPIQKSTCICHPTELRPLSVKEYARVQQFPDDWEFVGSTAAKYKQIGNAVPVGLGFAIGKTLLRYLDNFEEA